MEIPKQSVYLQIADDIKRKKNLGLLREGEKLMSCRELAIKLGINPNTVQRAYTLLENEGYIYTVPKKGVYVSGGDKKDYSEKIAREKITELKDAGLKREKLLDIINDVYKEDL